MKYNAIIPAPFSPLLDPSVRKIVEVSGRSSGKTTTNETVAISMMLSNRENNIWMCRAEKGDIRQSIYSSMWSTIQSIGVDRYFKSSLSPMEITCTVTGAKCYFSGINGKISTDLTSTKGFSPQGKTLAMFVVDEANEVKNDMHLKAAKSTADKFLLPYSKVVYAYNPPPIRTHWANRFFDAEIAAGATKIYTTYQDIAELLKPSTLQEIEDMRIHDPRQYEYWFLGKLVSLEGLVLYTFKRDRNVVTLDAFRAAAARGYLPLYIIYGVDSGIVKDPTAVCAWGIMPDTTLLKLSTFYLDPKKDREPIPNSKQVQHIREWYISFYNKFRSMGIQLPGAYNECWVFDSAVVTRDLMLEWQTATGFHCAAVENKNIERDIKRLQNGYFRGIFRFLDVPDNEESFREVESFCYDENNEIPEGQDDHTIDADKYATSHFYYSYMLMQPD